MKNKEAILALRKRIPIGITKAQKLLGTVGYNVSKAELIWKKNLVDSLATKISAKPDKAKELLEYADYDIVKALAVYEEKNTTDIGKILKSYENEGQVLDNFYHYISSYIGEEVSYGGWMEEKGFQKLPKLVQDILIVWQWYAFYDYENISVEQSSTQKVIEILESKLGLSQFAQELKQFKKIIDQFHEENPLDKKDLERYCELRNQIKTSVKYKSFDERIEQMEDLIMKKTYRYLYDNAELIDRGLKKINNENG